MTTEAPELELTPATPSQHEDPRIQPGAVVQIDPVEAINNDGFFGGCFMLVTERKSFGAQGFILIPAERGKAPGEAYFRARWDQMEYVGQAVWAPEPETDEAYAG